VPVVLCTLGIRPELQQAIRDVDPSVELYVAEGEAIDEYVGRAEVWFGRSLDPARLARARRLKWWQVPSAGVDKYLFPEFVASSVVLTAAQGINDKPVADHACMFVYAFARNLPTLLENQRQRRWRRAPASELDGETIGIIGLGRIGLEIARRARNWGMKVLATKRRPDPVEGVDRVFGPDGLEELLRRSDYVVVAVPHTPRTVGLIGARQLRLMRPTAVLINISRGGIIKEDDLVAAIKGGVIRGAGLDCFQEEPLPADSPLWDLPNVVITPHCGGAQRDYDGRATEFFCNNLRRYIDGRPLLRVVDKQEGY